MDNTTSYLSDKELGAHDLVMCGNCKGIHFRHAGNVLTYRTYGRHDKKVVDNRSEEIEIESHLVYICIDCGNPWVNISGQLVDGVELIDVEKFDAMNQALKDDTKTDPHC